MSASLVGSEMCIRDRLTTDLTRLGTLELWPCLRRHALPSSVAAATRWTCLLYTSDAADDM
eukprot:12251916-Alexandrium_andersonii.AAC.1